MAYEDARCPCGGKKPTNTMLCDDCNAAFAERKELSEYQDGNLSLNYRQHAAMILIALAKQRKRHNAA